MTFQEEAERIAKVFLSRFAGRAKGLQLNTRLLTIPGGYKYESCANDLIRVIIHYDICNDEYLFAIDSQYEDFNKSLRCAGTRGHLSKLNNKKILKLASKMIKHIRKNR